MLPLCTTTEFGITYDDVTHTVTGPGTPDAISRDFTNSGAYQYDATAPVIVSVSPDTVAQGTLQDVLITAVGTSWVDESAPAISGSGVTTITWTRYSASQILATFAVDSNAAVGLRNVTVTTGMTVDTLTNGFTITSRAQAVFAGKFWKR
jgi:hypothetical protein